MNKKEFLEKIEKKLLVLDEKERKDILDEYKDTISEKVKRGQSEEEAVADFGDIDELVKEVLSAYKIDPDYDVKEESTFNKILNDGEDLIKKGADKLAKTSRDLASDFKKTNKDINLSLVFEIVIKIIIAIFLIGFLRLPFLLVYRVGGEMLDSIFSPFGDLFSFLFGILLFIIYISLCVLVFVSLFKSYFKHEESADNENMEDENLEEDVKKEVKAVKVKEQSGHSFLGESIMLILKLWLIIFVMVPAAFIDLGILFGLCLSVVYWIKGINLFGLTLLLIGCLVMCTWFIKLIYNVIFKSGKNNFIVLVGSIVLIIIGGLLFTDMVINIDYRDGVPASVEKTVKDFEYQIDGNTNVYNYTGGDVKKEVAEGMKDGDIRLEVTYYKDVHDVSVEDYKDNGYRRFQITTDNEGAGRTKFMYNQFIDNLKNNKIYDYDRYYYIDVVVYGNEATLKMIGESE